MDAIAGLTFREARLLWLAAAAVVALVLLLWRERRRRELGERFVAESLRGVSNRVRGLRPFLLSLGLALTVVALAGPRLGNQTIEIAQPTRQRVIVVDVSQSMDAADVGASRLSSAKAITAGLLSDGSINRAALVIFEASPMVISPLTTDTGAVATLLESIGSGEVNDPGSDIGEAVRKARELVGVAAADSTDIVVLSDGEDQGESLDRAIREASVAGIHVHAILLGQEAAATIPTPRGPLTTEEGEVVQTTAHAEPLQRLARETGGRFIANPNPSAAAIALADLSLGQRDSRGKAYLPVERYQWPLTAGILLLLIGGIANRGAE
jgi:Ca-activated chloride channel family protein